MSSWKSRIYDSYIPKEQLSSAEENIKFASPGRFFAGREQRVRRVISRHLPPNRDIRVLDLGCGHGAYLYFLRAAGYKNITGVDVSPQQVDVAHKLGIKEAECCEILRYLEETKPDSVDVVLLIDVLEHLTREELFTLLDQVHRVLRPGGTCVAHVPNAEGIFGMRVRFGDLTHENAFSPSSVRQLYQTLGFFDTHCFEDEPEMHGLTSFFRYLVWKVGTLPHRLLLAAETGESNLILSQNMLTTARKL
jgi:SAM-dependent methyltransferase